MKIIIKESRADDLILKYLEKYIHPDYGWGSELFDFYRREIRKYGYIDFTINDDSAYVFINDEQLGEFNKLMIRDTIADKLSGLFGDRWYNIFIKWFEENTGLTVEHFKIESRR